jgi:hypothetical protein
LQFGGFLIFKYVPMMSKKDKVTLVVKCDGAAAVKIGLLREETGREKPERK